MRIIFFVVVLMYMVVNVVILFFYGSFNLVWRFFIIVGVDLVLYFDVIGVFESFVLIGSGNDFVVYVFWDLNLLFE